MSFESLHTLERLGRVYRARFLEPAWKSFPGWRESRWDGLGIFLSVYAFERQGRNPAYSPAAAAAIRSLTSKVDFTDDNLPDLSWAAFQSKLPDTRLNIQNCPMAPRGTPYLFAGRRLVTQGKSAVQLAQALPGPLLTALHACSSRVAFDELTQVNGIGEKIAAFFLRDLSIVLGRDSRHDPILLQPIDIWVRRASDGLGLAAVNAPARAVASTIVQACESADISAELVNAGMWYAGALVVGAELPYRAALKDGTMEHLAASHIADLTAAIAAWQPL